jgi:hypothetical protein
MLSESKGVKQFLRNGHARLDVKVKKGDIDEAFAVLEDMVLVATVSCLG